VSGNSYPLEPQAVEFGAPPPFVRLPDVSNLFAKRSERFVQLASTRQPAGFFLLLSHLAKAQHRALEELTSLPMPTASYLEYCRENRLAPFAPDMFKPDTAWLSVLSRVLDELSRQDLTADASSAVRRARQLDRAVLQAWGSAIVRGIYEPVDRQVAPFIFGALQVYWAKLASQLEAEKISRLNAPGDCPVCGCPPVAGRILAEGQFRGNRYLWCNLCATQWHLVRIKCSNCESTEGIAYYSIEGQNQAIKAETCEKCKTYLKLMYLEQDVNLDPVADDTGSYALDLMLSEQGYHRRTPVSFLFAAPE